MKILIVDDSKAVADVVSIRLNEEGYETSIRSNGTEGIEAIKSEEFDAVLLDLFMPGLSGLEVIEELRKSGHINLTRVIVMTASEISSPELTNLMKKGVAAWIRKPINFETLFGTLRNLIKK